MVELENVSSANPTVRRCNATYGPTVGLTESSGCTALKDAPLGRAFSLEKREHARNAR
jgi:hypothetical protein